MYNLTERLILVPSLNHIQVSVLATSHLECGKRSCSSRVSPFPSVVVSLLQEFRAKRILWRFSSHPTKKTNDNIIPSSPSGVSVLVEFADKSNSDSNKERFLQLLNRLVDERMVLAPLGAVTQKRLHRHVFERGNELEVVLPMEASPVASEGLYAFTNFHACPRSGIWSLASATEWSNMLLGVATDISLQIPRMMWMDMVMLSSSEEKECLDGGSCTMRFEQGLSYGIIGQISSPSHTLPSATTTNFKPCVFADATVVEMILPASVPMERAVQPESDMNVDDSDGNQRLIRRALQRYIDSSSDWMHFDALLPDSSPQHVSLEKTIGRPVGVTNPGVLITRLHNRHPDCAMNITLVDVLPNFIQPTTIGIRGTESTAKAELLHDDTIVMEHSLILKALQSASLRVDYDPVLLAFERFPADPNRGMELPPTVAHIQPLCQASDTTTLYSNSLLLMPPVPDMSMPFNVISLTCTFYVFVIGSIINTVVRRGPEAVTFALYPERKPKKKSIKDRIRAFWSRGSTTEHNQREEGSSTNQKSLASTPKNETDHVDRSEDQPAAQSLVSTIR